MRKFLRQLLVVSIAGLSGPVHADDNTIAYRLFQEGRYAEAGELFTDPAWKGVAFYRSDQWWRAAEAFVRANDAGSLYNLGNCYAKLGYHALALEAYLGSLRINPGNKDAEFNADLMREILKSKDNNSGQASLKPEAREIDRREAPKEKDGEGDPEEAGNNNEDAPEKSGDNGNNKDPEETSETPDSQQSQSGEGEGDIRDDTGQAQAAVDGEKDDDAPEGETSGGSKAAEESKDAEAAGRRARLEESQATQQWLNAIRDDPGAFLAKRIALEMRRRAANGTLPEPDANPW